MTGLQSEDIVPTKGMAREAETCCGDPRPGTSLCNHMRVMKILALFYTYTHTQTHTNTRR